MASGLFFDESNPGTWFSYTNDKQEEEWKICLRICTMEELERIRKETVKKKVAFKKVEGTPHRFVWEEVDEKAQSQMIWDYCISAWEGVYNKNGEDIPCTAENKLMLMQKSQVFAKFVTECMKQLNKEEEEQKTEAEKN